MASATRRTARIPQNALGRPPAPSAQPVSGGPAGRRRFSRTGGMSRSRVPRRTVLPLPGATRLCAPSEPVAPAARGVPWPAVPRNEDISGSVGSLHGELDELFAELWAGPRRRRRAVQAPADVFLTEDPPTLTVQLDLAGVDPERLRIVLDGDLLIIAGERSRPHGERRVYQHAEIDWGPFERRLRLGVPVDAEAVTAGYDRGLLTVALPLARRARRSRVPITVRG